MADQRPGLSKDPKGSGGSGHESNAKYYIIAIVLLMIGATYYFS